VPTDPVCPGVLDDPPVLRRTGRRLSALLTMASVMLVSLLALPAAAEGAEAAAGGFGTGVWDGMIMAAIAGVIMGIVAFAVSNPGDIHRVDDHH
jgi:hypothetical protein